MPSIPCPSWARCYWLMGGGANACPVRRGSIRPGGGEPLLQVTGVHDHDQIDRGTRGHLAEAPMGRPQIPGSPTLLLGGREKYGLFLFFFFLFYLFARTSLPATRNEFDHTVRHGESRSCSLESFACRSMGPQLMKKDQVGRFSLVLKVRLLLSGLVLPGAREL